MKEAIVDLRSEMRFQSPYQHSLAQLKRLRLLAAKTDPSIKELALLLSESALHGQGGFASSAAKMSLHDRPDIRRFVAERRLLWTKVRAIPQLAVMQSDTALVQALYRLDDPYFEQGSEHPQKLLILFTTMFNNFELSNLAVLGLLCPLGVSVLILKDASSFNYLLGIPGFGSDMSESIAALKRFIAEKGIEQVYISGYSGAGYAAMLVSTLLKCSGYLGFSVRTDLAADSSRSPGALFTDAARACVPESLCQNLAPRLNAGDHTLPYRIIYGSRSDRDRAHATNLADRPGIVLEEIEGCGHFPISRLLVEDRLAAVFSSLIFQG